MRALATKGAGIQQEPGETIGSAAGSRKLSTRVEWSSHYPLDRVEVVADGRVVESRSLVELVERQEGVWVLDVDASGDGWIGARAYGQARDSFGQAVYAHTSPVYVGSGVPGDEVREAATFFTTAIDGARELISEFGRFTRDEQRQEVLHLFDQGRKVYARLQA